MSTTTPKASTDRLFDAILERQAGIFDAIRSRNDRLHRFNRSVIEGARQGVVLLVDPGDLGLAVS